jgi:hypothetical protein
MITKKNIERIVATYLQPDETAVCMQLYSALPFLARQTCAEQLVVEPTLVPLFFGLLKNEEAFITHAITDTNFLSNEMALVRTLQV